MINILKKIERSRCISVLLCVAVIFSAMVSLSLVAKAENSNSSKIMVSLGDSYSSGEGIVDEKGKSYFYGQNEYPSEKVKNPDWLAHRSERSWPGMLTLPSGKMSENKGTNWYFAAASGAETTHMLYAQKKEYDRSDQVNRYSGSYNLPPQLNVFDELGEDEADYVTLTLGGNDAGFSEIVTAAVMDCGFLKFGNLTDKLKNTWVDFYKDGGIRDNLRQASKSIADKAGPQAKIIVAGYPQLLDPNGSKMFFSSEEASEINNSVSKFNDEIETIIKSCKTENMKICFVSVEEYFKNNQAYSDDPFINKVMVGIESEDLDDSAFPPVSAYSMHPNEKGAEVYRDCVQKKIDELEEDGGQSEWTVRETSDERDIVLVLDASGSMSGTPMEETKKASEKFVNTILKEDASIGIVTYDNSAMTISDFNMNESYLFEAVQGLNDGGGTNIESGLSTAYDMLQHSNAEKKIIVLMSDGEPNDGKVGEELIAYADNIKDEGIYIYTLGFFESLGSKLSAQTLMEKIASEGCHYEVADADNLVFFFGDIADQINGQKYIYVRIACPVDVTVSYNGETLSSSDDGLNVRTGFGSLTFEENESDAENNSDNRVKVLRLKEGTDYDIRIEGTGRGRMNYTIGFMDENGEYSDLRKFTNIKISKKTVIDTVAANSNTTVLNVDEDGDGKYDLKYRAAENGRGEIVDYTYIIYIVIGVIVFVVMLIVFVKVKKRIKKIKK